MSDLQNKTVKVRKKFTLKKVKKIFVSKLNKMVSSFNNLDVNVRKVIVLWAVIILIVVASVVFCAINNNFLKKKHTIEDYMKEATMTYVTTKKIYPTDGSPLIMSMDALRNLNYLFDDEVTDDTCKGYTKTVYRINENDDGEYLIESFISCKNYTTKGYND